MSRDVFRRIAPAWVRILAGLAVAGCLWASPAAAQIYRNFTPRFTTNTTGDITLIGNTIMSCPSGGGCTNARNGGGGNQNNNDWSMTYVDVDGDGSTFSSSRATLTLPAGATVVWAGLYWGGFTNNANRNTCRFATPAAAYATLTADQLDNTGQAYSAFEDVTARVQAGGNGQYTVGNVYSSTGSNNYGGWSLVVVYQLATAPTRNLVVFDGYAQVAPGASVNIPVNGFLTPPAGAVNTTLGAVTYEGDRGFTGDDFDLNGIVLSDAGNPINNFFNSSIGLLGAQFTNKNPNYVNQLGFDADLVDADGILANGATSATIQLSSTDDRFYPAAVTFATELYVPVISGNGFAKFVTDLNGAPAQPGDVLEYTVFLRNTGNDASLNTIARDTIPANAAYVAGSMSVLTGPNVGAKSDGTGDDQADFDATGNRVVFRLGTGANGANGGQMSPGVQTSFRFRAVITSPSPTGTVISNQAIANFNAAQLGTALTSISDADTVVAGTQRTNTTVTAPTLSGVVFEDPNYGGGAGRNRTASAGVVRSGARVELYNSTGAYQGFSTTNASGVYSFNGWGPGNYTVRVVNSTVTSSRSGAVATLVPVQTFRTDASTGVAVDDAQRVGGESPGLQDAGSNLTNATLASLTTVSNTPQSVAPVTLAGADLSGVEFGFNFSTIVNANDAGQGSLRQFLTNSNTLANTGLAQAGLTAGVEHSIFMVPDGAAHPGLRAGIPNLLTGGVVAINVASTLPAMTGASTTLDGGRQTTNVGDTNAGTLGTGGTAGVGALPLPAVGRPEVELRDGAGLLIGIDIQANDVIVAGLAAYGFGNTPTNNAHAVVRIGATAARAIIDNCVLGTSASSFADPGAATRSAGDVVRSIGGDDGIVRNSLIGFAAGSGISLAGTSDRWQILSNEIRGNAIGNSTRDGVHIEAGATETVSGNLIANHDGCGIDAATSTGSNTFVNNTVTRSGLGSGAAETPGIRVGGATTVVDRCILFDNYGAGVMVASGATAVTITRNSTYGNGTISGGLGGASGQIGIDLLTAANAPARGTSPFYTLNDNGDGDAGGNGLLNFPVLETATISVTSLTLTGWARPGSAIEIFIAAPDPSGFGEGQTYLTTVTEGTGADLDATTGPYAGPINGVNQGSDNTNRFRFTVPVPVGLSPGMRLTATATVALATSEFSGLVLVGGGIAVSGFGYEDLNHDLQRDGVEDGIGSALFIKLVPTSSPGSAQSVASVDPGTGAWIMPIVAAGNYTLVLDDNNVVTDVTPTHPAGWIGTEVPTGLRPLTVAAVDVSNLDFGLWHGGRAEGFVFDDDGTGGGTANDGARQGGEAALAGIRVRLASTACAGGACDSTLTDGAGSYVLWIPHAASGIAAEVREVNASGWISTGGAAGTTGGSYARPADAVSFTPVSGNVYTGVRFGDVAPNQLVPPSMLSGPEGSVVFHPHTFVAGSAGDVTFGVAQSPAPPIPGWGVQLYRDLDCDGVVDAGEPVIAGPQGVTASQTWCLVVRHSIPAGAPGGAFEQVTLSASMSYTAAVPPLSTVVQLDDRTTVIDAGTLRIVKSVSTGTVLPGGLITYTITYTNLGPAPVSAIEIQDMVPGYTMFQSAGCGGLGSGLSACGVTTQPSPNGTGPVRWTLTGSLDPGATGSVTFQVRVE
jgi:uncharacterized repeat protein (TIGR01451 family)